MPIPTATLPPTSVQARLHNLVLLRELGAVECVNNNHATSLLLFRGRFSQNAFHTTKDTGFDSAGPPCASASNLS